MLIIHKFSCGRIFRQMTDEQFRVSTGREFPPTRFSPRQPEQFQTECN
jgi:hypothetical protein